jgi:photoactive yellow protein
MKPVANEGSVQCAWCSAELKRGSLKTPLGHGVCLACSAAGAGTAIEDLAHIGREALDGLPFGAIQISGDGLITGYNTAESRLSGLAAAQVMGKHFFRDVAPCAAVQDFGGKFAALRASGQNGRGQLRFIFKYARGAKLVEVVMVYDAATDRSTLLVKPVLTEPKL